MNLAQIRYSRPRQTRPIAATMPKRAENPRRKPQQARARVTFDAILDAAAQILSAKDSRRFTTNHIAERAGVSVGTLYQYFGDKDGILIALFDREQQHVRRQVRQLLAEANPGDLEGGVRALIRVLIASFVRRSHAKRAFLLNLARRINAPAREEKIPDIMREAIDVWNGIAGGRRKLEDMSAFVLAHALLGALRSAILNRPSLLKSQAFEDELVSMALNAVGVRSS